MPFHASLVSTRAALMTLHLPYLPKSLASMYVILWYQLCVSVCVDVRVSRNLVGVTVIGQI